MQTMMVGRLRLAQIVPDLPGAADVHRAFPLWNLWSGPDGSAWLDMMTPHGLAKLRICSEAHYRILGSRLARSPSELDGPC